jgi:uncharacterized protein DUF4430
LASGRPNRLLALAAAALLAATVASCGFGAGATPTGTHLLVTTDFGQRGLVETDQPKTGGSDTVMRLLERNAGKVAKRYGGGFVQSIDGRSGGTRGGRPVDWFYYVNGVEADKGATSERVRQGERIWWDLHDWGTAMRIPAVVGQFPEPFVHGVAGRKLPTRVECEQLRDDACRAVRDKLVALDVPAATGTIARSFVQDTLRVLVGRWQIVRDDPTVGLISKGPQDSGVFVKPSADGRSFAVLDPRGRPVRTLGPGTGLIAAVKTEDEQPVWVVTGTDAAGVSAAIDAFSEGALDGRFAIAISGGRTIPLPEVGR